MDLSDQSNTVEHSEVMEQWREGLLHLYGTIIMIEQAQTVGIYVEYMFSELGGVSAQNEID